MTLGISKGSDWRYVAREVGKGSENYYTSAVDAGEPAGVWRGSAAAELGLVGNCRDLQLEALYGHFIDPRDENFENRAAWPKADRLGRKPQQFKTQEEIFAELVAQEPDSANIEHERAEQLWYQAGTKVRESRAFFDATYSPSKSVSVLYTAFMSEAHEARQKSNLKEAELWADRAKIVEDAVWEASGEMIAWMEREAGYSRSGYHGSKLKSGETTGRWQDAHKFTVASFLQHTSRPVGGVESPQLHVHNLILNRVECADGKWRTLDGKALYQERAAAGATADRVVVAKLAERLGIEFAYDPQSKSMEVKGIGRDVRAAFSARRQAIVGMLPRYVEAFESRFGRSPSALELSTLAQRATLQSREAKLSKAKASTLEKKVEQWTKLAREQTSTTLSEIARSTLHQRDANAEMTFDPAKVIAAAVRSIESTKATWTRSDLIGHLNRCLPAELGSLDTEYQSRLLGELADIALRPDPARIGKADEVIRLDAPELVATPNEFRLANGESSFSRHGSSVYATRALLEAEERIEAAVQDTGATAHITTEQALAAVAEVNAGLAKRDPNGTAKLSDDQAAILEGILSSGARTEVIVGPAGTGKSFIMGKLADEWERRIGGRVTGLATAQIAADVLQDEGLAQAENIANWIKVQKAIDNGKASPAEKAKWSLRRNDMVIVDEASMVSTQDLAEIQRRADLAGAKIVLVGDHRQLDAVGAGGSFVLAQDAADKVYELKEVRRFKAGWEKAASLKLREGDADAVAEYDARGRVVGCTSLDEAYDIAARNYVADTLAGKKSFIVVGSNDEAGEASSRVRNALVERGLVAERGVAIGKDNVQAVAGEGDILQARRNSRRVGNSSGEHLVNRGRYLVTETRDDGSMMVRALGDDGALGEPIEVPDWYAQRQMTLAYATTQHGVEGATAYSSYGIITPSTSAQAGYVAGSRGTDMNMFLVVDALDAQDADQLGAKGGEHEPRSAAAILTEVITGGQSERSATQVLRDNLADTGSMRVIGHRLYEAHRWISEHKWAPLVTSMLNEDQADRFESDDARYALYRLLDSVELFAYEPEEVLADAIGERELGTADSLAQVIHWRIANNEDLDLDPDSDANQRWLADLPEPSAPTGDTYSARVPEGDTKVHKFAAAWAELADERAADLGEICVEHPPQWALDHLGPVPDESEENFFERRDWIRKAGIVQAYREQYGLVDQTTVIGRAPEIGQVERYEEWHSAHRALGSPEFIADERELPDFELQQRLADYEAEKTWAPPAVKAELRQTSRDAHEARTNARLLEDELARTPKGDVRYAQLLAEVEQTDARATKLEERAARLERIHTVRGRWYLETEEERDAAAAAQKELERREAERARAIAEAEAQAETDTAVEAALAADDVEVAATADASAIEWGDDWEAEPTAEAEAETDLGADVEWNEPETPTPAQADQAQTATAEEPAAEAAPEATTETEADREAEQEATAEAEPANEKLPAAAQAVLDAHTRERETEKAAEPTSAGAEAVAAAFPEREERRPEPVDLDEAEARLEQATMRLEEIAKAKSDRRAAAEAELEAEEERERLAAEAAIEALERDRDAGIER